MNRLYPKIAQAMLTGGFDWDAATVGAAGLSSAYIFDAAHEFLLSLQGGMQATSMTFMSSLDGAGGNASGAFDYYPVFRALTTNIASIVLYDWTGSYTTSRLIAYIDDADGLPLTANGGDVYVTWDNNIVFTL